MKLIFDDAYKQERQSFCSGQMSQVHRKICFLTFTVAGTDFVIGFSGENFLSFPLLTECSASQVCGVGWGD